MFATLFIYDQTSRDTWFVMTNGAKQADGSFLGDLYRVLKDYYKQDPAEWFERARAAD